MAIDPNTKLAVSYRIGSRDLEDAHAFMQDVAGRLAHRVQLTTDGYRPYLSAVDAAFGDDVDYAVLVKLYGRTGNDREPNRRYSPAVCIGADATVIKGSPDKTKISTSHVERQNLTGACRCGASRG